jgi:hypothetical protein
MVFLSIGNGRIGTEDGDLRTLHVWQLRLQVDYMLLSVGKFTRNLQE